ncbi:MAG: tetratricopeptide repeat protein [Candidatus Firestonebacteria bacterium]
MRIVKPLLLFVFLLTAGNLSALDFKEANKLYEAGKYSEAVTAYNSLKDGGNNSAELLFNLGNAYFKDKRTGYALLCYERAHKIAPRDADIKYNLDFARSFIKENAVEDPASRFVSRFYYFLTLNELCALLTSVFIVLLALLFLRLSRKDELTYWLTFSFSLLFLLLFVFSAVRIYEQENTRSAIIVSPSVEARAAPLESNPASFTLPEGKKVLLLNFRNDWVEILLRTENIKGWIKKDALAEI